MVYEISRVGPDGDEVDLHVERKAPVKTSNPFTNPEPVFDASEVIEHISNVQRENLERLDDDVAILTKYLKTQNTPKATISALEGLRIEQHESWKTAVERIEELLEE
jgi:hypothetical protein